MERGFEFFFRLHLQFLIKVDLFSFLINTNNLQMRIICFELKKSFYNKREELIW